MLFVSRLRILVNAMVHITASVRKVSFRMAVVGNLWCTRDLLELTRSRAYPICLGVVLISRCCPYIADKNKFLNLITDLRKPVTVSSSDGGKLGKPTPCPSAIDDCQ